MVGYDPYSQFELSTFEYGVAGVVSGLLTRFTCQPLDVVKIRFQLQVDPVRKSKGSKYYAMHQAFRMITTEEGVSALWKGHVPAQGLSVVFGVVQFAAFEVLTKGARLYLPSYGLFDEKLPFVTFACGALSGGMAMTTALPLDVIRTRLVAQGEPKVYRSVSHAVSQMYRTEGVRAFYRGFIPTLCQTAPYTGLQFAFYTGALKTWNRLMRSSKDYHSHQIGALRSFVCGSIAGTTAKIAVYPLDMIKKRLQIVGFEKARHNFGTVHKYDGLNDCVKMVLRHEGVSGLFKGLWPSIVKAAATSGCGFLVYEQMCRLLAAGHKSGTV